MTPKLLYGSIRRASFFFFYDYVHIIGHDRTITVILAKHCIELVRFVIPDVFIIN